MGGRRLAGASKKNSVVYQRKSDSDSLWDDADLIRLWNAQLEQDKDREAEAEKEAEEHHQSSDAHGSDSEDEENGDSVVTSAEENGVPRDSVRSAGPECAAPDTMRELPADIRKLAAAYYRAGFEAGYYIGVHKSPACHCARFDWFHMRGNRYSRGGDPMKTRAQRRKERLTKISKTNRAQRLKKRMGRIVARRCMREQDSHMTAIMESYAHRRKAERKAEREAQQQQEEEEGNRVEGLSNGKPLASMKNSRPPTQQRRSSSGESKNNKKSGRLITRPQAKVTTRSLY